MVKIYFVRHGYSVGNERDIITGFYDCDLCELGFKQADLVSQYIVNNIKVDAFYSSDLLRAVNTIKPAADKLNMPIYREKAFRELGSGDWEGISFKVVQELYPKEFKEWASKQPGTKAPNGETWENLQERAVTRINQIVEQNDNKTIVVSAHGGVIKALQCCFLGKKLTEMDELPWVSNASISEAHYDNGKYEIIEIGKDDYLNGLTTQFTDAL